MDKQSYRLSGLPGISLPRGDADKLLEAADGTCALLYIYLLRTEGNLSPAAAARALRRTEKEVRDAAERLRALGLIAEGGTEEGGRAALLGPADELPEYTSEEIARKTGEDPAFRGLLAETQRVLGRLLSGAELRTLFGIYVHLGLPADVAYLLVNHCAETVRERWGEGRVPTLRAIEKEAYVWANREILTLEQAEAYLHALAERKETGTRLRKLLQLGGREPSPTERKYMDGWLDLGFSPESLAIAYDRTVVSTGRLTWRYMDSIVRRWHEKGLHTPAEIERGDARQGCRKASAAPAASDYEDRNAKDLERLLKKYN
jgi:hypothetical protein